MEPVDRPAPPRFGQARGLELLDGESLAQQVFGERVPPAGRIATTELLPGGGVEMPVGEILSRGLGLRLAQLRDIELVRRGIGRDQPRPGAAITMPELDAFPTTISSTCTEGRPS